MATIRFSIDTSTHTIILTNIKMNQDGFIYNGTNFTKIDDNSVEVKYKKDTFEHTQEGIDCNLTWGLNSIMSVLSEYSKPGCNPYKETYVMFEFEF